MSNQEKSLTEAEQQECGLVESVSLGAILMITLLISLLEHQAFFPEWLSQCAFASPLLLVMCLVYHVKFRSRVRLYCRGSMLAALQNFLIVLAGFAAMLLMVAGVVQGILSLPPSVDHETQFISIPKVNFGFFTSAVIIAPLAEELFFRGLLLEHLRRYFGIIIGILVSSALFALVHLPQAGPRFALLMLTASIVLCIIALLTRALVIPILIHMYWNCYVYGTLFNQFRLTLAHQMLLMTIALLLLDISFRIYAKYRKQKPATEIS